MINNDRKSHNERGTQCDTFLNYEELSEFLSISKRHASNLVRLGKIRKFKLGNSTRFLRSEIIEDLIRDRDSNIRKEVIV